MKLGNDQILSGPSRVFPGRLSVCRSFGDIEAKLEHFGGNPKVIISEPEIEMFRLTEEYDFILLGCDGIFDQIKNEEVVNCAWMTLEKNLLLDVNVHNQSGLVVDMVMKTALARKSLDNITSVFIGFENWEKIVLESAEIIKAKSNKSPKKSIHHLVGEKHLNNNPSAKLI